MWRSGWRAKSTYLAAGACGAVLGYGTHWSLGRRVKAPALPSTASTAIARQAVFDPVSHHDFSEARRESQLLIREIQEKSKSPGVSVAVGVDGELVWAEGFGYADVENRVACSRHSMMRIASISKPVTMLLLARLWDAGRVDLDAPVQKYVPAFPEKVVDGETVTVTTRMLLHHIGGVRHYKKEKRSIKNASVEAKTDGGKTSITTGGGEDTEMSRPEYFLMEHYDSVGASLELFMNDPLCHKPGEKHLYTTHGWTLISAVIEGAGGRPFLDQLGDMLHQLGLENVQAEHMDKLIHHRARFYQLTKDCSWRNAPYVDNSYKWAGGGLVANVEDIVRFGCTMLVSYFGKPLQECPHDKQPKPCAQCTPYIKKETVETMWTAHPVTIKSSRVKTGYGMGWVVRPRPADSSHDVATMSHTGSAIGASSALVIIPPADKPHAVVVAIICNMEDVNLEKTARLVGQVFLRELSKHETVQPSKVTATA